MIRVGITGQSGFIGTHLAKYVMERDDAVLVPFEDAIDAASINPMKYIGMDDHKGRIKYGYDADIVVLNDDYSVKQTYCRGIAQLS